jgi:hypothetical protein
MRGLVTVDLTSDSVTPVLQQQSGGGGGFDQKEVTAHLSTAYCLQYKHIWGKQFLHSNNIIIYIFNNTIFENLC